MESLEESTSNQEKVDEKSDDNKAEDNSLKENGVQETLPKKKFARTNFALKMKNKRKEEKLNNLDTKETLSSCKEVSIDVTRLTSNPVPKIITAVENKIRKKKRSQWKMGIMKKKKKSFGKDIKINPLSKELVNGESNHVGEDINTSEIVKIKKEEPMHPKSEMKKQPIATDGETLQRRKSLRSTTSSISEANVCEPENKVEIKSDEENFSCRRTEPFIGKLLTKEARDEIANRILKGETAPKVKSNNETDKKDVAPESKESKADDVNKSLSESSKKSETNDNIDKKTEKTPKPTVMDTSEKVIKKPSRKSMQTMMDTDEKVLKHSSRRSTQSLTDTDEKVINRPSRRSTQSVMETDEKVIERPTRRSMQSLTDTDEKVIDRPSRRSTQSVMETDEKVIERPTRRSTQSLTETDEKVIDRPSRRSTQSAMGTDEKVIDRPSRRSTQSVMETDEKVIVHPSRRSASKIEAKESIKIEEVSCSRTMPFVGKAGRKSAAGVPERQIEVDSSTNQSDEKSLSKDDTNNLDSTAANKTELINTPKDINANADSTLGIKILSVSSLKDDDSMKTDFLPEKVDKPANEPVVIPLKDQNVESDSSNKNNMDSDASANKTKAKSKLSKLSKSTKLETPIKSVQEQTDSLSEKTDTTKETRRSVSSVRRRSSLRSNISVKSDSLSEEFDAKSSMSTFEDVQNPWSCQRVVPFRGNNKSLVTEEAPNQTEAFSTAPEISSVPSDDITTPPKPTPDRLVSEEANQLPKNSSQSEIENDVTSKDSEKVESAAEAADNLDARSSSVSPVLKGEWKFRRKRQILSSDDENQDKELIKQNNKKTKVQSPSITKIHTDKKAVTLLSSPGKTICSFLSTKCTKHDHHSQSGPCSSPKDVKPQAYVLLTRLEDMEDPEVKGYFLKTDLVDTIKRNYRRIMVDKDTNDTLKTKSDRERSISTSTQATKDDLAPSNVLETAQESDSNSSFRPSQEIEDTSSQSTSTSRSRRRTSSRASSESPILHTKRKKRSVNYLEEFSDSDEYNQSSCTRLRSQSRGSTLRDRGKTGVSSTLDEEEDMENDMEVEEFSRVGRQNGAEDSNQEDFEQDTNCSGTEGIKSVEVFKKAQTRCKSVAEKKISDTPKYPTRSKTPHIGMSVEKPVKVLNASEIDKKKLEEDLVQGLKSMEETINKEMEKRGLIPPGSSKSLKTQSLRRQVSSEQLPSTPSVSANKPLSPKKISSTPQNDIASPQTSTTPRRSVTFQRNELLSKVTKSASQLVEDDRKKEMKIKDVRVQLVKLEAVCSDYKDYSASEIELLTNKYIDMLMNSNFACDTWRVNPIKLATSYTRTVDSRGDEDDSDPESQDNGPLPFEEVQVPMDSVDINAEQNIANESPRRKTPNKSNKQPVEVESVIATLPLETSLHEKTFGAINISEALSQPAVTEEDAENIRLLDSTTEDDAAENGDSIGPARDSDAILVNGTEVHACALCNKIFMKKELLQKHVDENHSSAEKSSNSTTVQSSKSIEKQAPGPASSKKVKKKLKNKNNSLKCTICLESYATKELLFDHIMTHNENDLQQAYKAAKEAKLQQSGEIEETNEEQAKKQKQKSNHRQSTDSSSAVVSGEELAADDARAATSLADTISQQTSSSNIVVTTQSLLVTGSNKALTACQCHAHELASQDLHIEMVLLCTACNVIYRRRDCFEVHFRTSADCRRERANGKVTKLPKLFCSGCRCVLNTLLEMRSHLEKHAQNNNTGTVTFLCNICKVAFFGVGGIFYSHWYNHEKSPNFVASRYSFPKLSVVSVLEDVNGTMTTSKSQEGFFYIAEHVCRECRLPFSSDPELQKHKQLPCQPPQPVVPRVEPAETNRLQMIKLICDLCKKYYVSKDHFDKHCNERNHLKTPITKFSRLPVSDTEQVFVCSLCRGLSKTLDEMKEHWKCVHSPIMELYTCKTCNVVPSNDVANYTYDKFERHCRLAHKSEIITCLVYFVTARYVCNVCKFGFETEKSMKEHELVHQKKVATQSLPVQNATNALPLAAAQTATFFVADNPQTDGVRRLHPVVVQYPNINGALTGPMQVTQLPNQPQLQLPSQMNQPNGATAFIATNINPIALPATNVVRMPNAVAINQDNNPELRSLLQNALQGPGQRSSTTLPQQQSQQPNTEKIVETIELDSRSNSPVLESPAASTSSSSNSLAAAKKAYMTKVNPNFETILQTTTGNQENRDNTPNSDKSRPARDETATPAEVDTLTPQPFEVVLVTDELSENSDQDKNDNLASTASDEQPQQQQQAPEIIETKSFLRVRSVAELQSIKIHLCSICGLSFDTPYAFEQHEKQHRSMGELGRSTPVQMISPMVAPPSKESTDDPHNMLMTQMKQKLTMSMSNGSNPHNASASTHVNTRAMPMPNVLPHQPVLPPQQQQSWYPTTSNTTSSMSNMHYATSQPTQQPPQQQSLLRQTISSAPPSKTGYTTVRPPPPYPGSSNSMVASNRPSAIQLPDRSMTHNIPPQTKRPSGAATRIPQQSLQSYDDVNNRQTGGTVTYNAAPQQQQQQLPMQKTYGPAPNTVNYSTVNSTINYQSVPQSQPRQPPPQKNIIYTCKHPNCFYRSASLAGIRAHETIHLLPQQGQQSQQLPTTSNNQQQQQMQMQQQQQQQQQPARLLPVSQMPERTRHALPTSRPPVSSNSDKRITCRICNLNCATSIELIEHVSTVHSGANQVCCYVCDYCPSPLIFDTEDQLRKHMNVRHNHSCELCNKRYPSKEDLMLHKEVHIRRA